MEHVTTQSDALHARIKTAFLSEADDKIQIPIHFNLERNRIEVAAKIDDLR